MIKILALAGSTRKDSFNKKLLKVAAAGATATTADVTIIDLNDLPMPLFDEDLEANEGIPENAMKFKQLLKQSDGILIASPEYNGSYSAVLKNAIDWASRQAEGEKILECFKNKTVTLMSSSPGALGGIRGLTALRTLLSGIGCIVLPRQLALGKAAELFDDSGAVIPEKRQKSVQSLGKELVEFLQSMH